MTVEVHMWRRDCCEVVYRPSWWRRWFLREQERSLWLRRNECGLWVIDGYSVEGLSVVVGDPVVLKAIRTAEIEQARELADMRRRVDDANAN